MPELKLEGVSKSFPTRRDPLVVLRNISLELQSGQNLAIVGPSGSGKSTLLHLMGTLDTPTEGTITLCGENPFTLDEPQLAHFRNRRIGFVFQEHHLLPQLSALENVLIPSLAEGTPNDAMVSRARSLLERVGLSERLEHRPAELSGGERQRVGIARALIHTPSLLLADEPTGNLDRSAAKGIAELLVQLQQQEDTILVVVTHSVELANGLQRRMELDNGNLREA
ncbi:MAG: ABC transporter ATP-binding protein [Planctomycetota bacterium]|nr:ABC transporter ATP-binding protein [Planctomycetota bacterium]